MLAKADVYMHQRMKLDPYILQYKKFNSRGIEEHEIKT